LRAAKKWRPLAPSAAHTKSSGLQDARIHFKDEDRTNGVALPVDEGYIMLGHLVEREQALKPSKWTGGHWGCSVAQVRRPPPLLS